MEILKEFLHNEFKQILVLLELSISQCNINKSCSNVLVYKVEVLL